MVGFGDFLGVGGEAAAGHEEGFGDFFVGHYAEQFAHGFDADEAFAPGLALDDGGAFASVGFGGVLEEADVDAAVRAEGRGGAADALAGVEALADVLEAFPFEVADQFDAPGGGDGGGLGFQRGGVDEGAVVTGGGVLETGLLPVVEDPRMHGVGCRFRHRSGRAGFGGFLRGGDGAEVGEQGDQQQAAAGQFGEGRQHEAERLEDRVALACGGDHPFDACIDHGGSCCAHRPRGVEQFCQRGLLPAVVFAGHRRTMCC